MPPHERLSDFWRSRIICYSWTLLTMETACIRHTEIPHTSRLFSDFQYHFDRVARFYAHNPGDPSSYATVAGQMQYPPERRAALVASLRARNGDSPSLELLARPEPWRW